MRLTVYVLVVLVTNPLTEGRENDPTALCVIESCAG